MPHGVSMMRSRRHLQASHLSKKHVLTQLVEADVILNPGAGMSIEVIGPSPALSQPQPDAFQEQVPLEQPGGAALQLGPATGVDGMSTTEGMTHPQVTLGLGTAATSGNSLAASVPASALSPLSTSGFQTSSRNTLLVASSSTVSTSSSVPSTSSSSLVSSTAVPAVSVTLTSSDGTSSSSSSSSSVLSASHSSTSISVVTSSTSSAPTTTGSASRGADFYIGTVFGVIIALACLISFAAWLIRSRKGSRHRWWGANDDDSVNFDPGLFGGLEKGLDSTGEWPIGDMQNETRRAGSLIIPDPLPLPPRIQIDMPTPTPFIHARYPQPRPLPSHLHSAESLNDLGSMPRPLLVTNMVPGDIRSSGSSLGSPVFAHERTAGYFSVDNSTASLVPHAGAPGVGGAQNSYPLQHPSSLSLSAPAVTNSILPPFASADRQIGSSLAPDLLPAALSHKDSVASKNSASSSDGELLPLPGERNSSTEGSGSEGHSKESWGASLRSGFFSAISAMTQPSGSHRQLMDKDKDSLSPEPTRRLKRVDRRDIDGLEPVLKPDASDAEKLDRLKDLSALGISLRGDSHPEPEGESDSPKSPGTAPLSIKKKKSSRSVTTSKATLNSESAGRPTFLKRGSTKSSGLSFGSDGVSEEENRTQLILALRERRKKGMGVQRQGTGKPKKSVRSTKSSVPHKSGSKRKVEEPQDTLDDLIEVNLH